MSYRRTRREISLVIETKGLGVEDHERVVGWAQKNIIDANWNMRDAFVSVTIRDEQGNTRAFTGHGIPSPETEEIIKDLADDASVA